MNDEQKPRRIEDRLREWLSYGFNPHVEAATDKRLRGEVIDVFDDMCIEYIIGREREIRIQKPQGRIDADLAMYRHLEWHTDIERVEETLERYRQKVAVEEHALFDAKNKVIYTVNLPSRNFMKALNPYYPEQYRRESVDEIIAAPDKNPTTKARRGTEGKKSTKAKSDAQ
jgi:hypothetical protein